MLIQSQVEGPVTDEQGGTQNPGKNENWTHNQLLRGTFFIKAYKHIIEKIAIKSQPKNTNK